MLAPLGLRDIGRLVADALHCPPERARPLARLVQEKTGGNPFFAIQFLTALAEEGLLSFDPAVPAWQWDIDRIRARNYTDNVVESHDRQAAAAPGQDPGSRARARLPGQCRPDGHADPGARGNRSGDACGLPRMPCKPGSCSALEGAYRFPHDRIQQAAYALIPEAARAEIHLRHRPAAARGHDGG